jgi:uncharacterized protein YgbK (DUF1537 family)
MIAVIADDLSGATELAGVGWRFGLTTEILAWPEPVSTAELVVYDTDSRLRRPIQAARCAGRVALKLRRAKAEWVYKKVDSVLRGNVLAEIQAICFRLKLQGCLLAPANPQAGRIIRQGRYFINGVPLNHTDFRRDPVHPRRSCRVKQLLDPTGRRAIRLLNPGTRELPPGLAVGQAATAADLRHWAGLVTPATLPAGGAEFFRALLTARGLVPRHLPAEPAPQARRTLFVCGSISARSLEFIEASRKRNWPVVLMPPEVIAGKAAPAAQRAWTCGICAALPQHRHVLLGIGPPVNPGRRAGARLGNLLVDAAREVLMRCAPDRVCIEGGATAVLLLRRLGVTRLRVEHDFAMGVTAVRAANGAGPQIVVKPGSYPWPASLLA